MSGEDWNVAFADDQVGDMSGRRAIFRVQMSSDPNIITPRQTPLRATGPPPLQPITASATPFSAMSTIQSRRSDATPAHSEPPTPLPFPQYSTPIPMYIPPPPGHVPHSILAPPPPSPTDMTSWSWSAPPEPFPSMDPFVAPPQAEMPPLDAAIPIEDRLVASVQAIRKSGFADIGAFFVALLADVDAYPLAVKDAVAAFLAPSEDTDPEQAVQVLELMFKHRRSQRYERSGAPRKPHFDLPRHALPPSTRLSAHLPPRPPNTMRNAMLNWAVSRVLEQVDRESNALLETSGPEALIQRPTDEPLTWDTLLSFSMVDAQKRVAERGPVSFAVLSTIAVNKTARGKLDKRARVDNVDDDDDVSPSDGDEREQPGEGDAPEVPTKFGRRDPWQAVTAFIIFLLAFRTRYLVLLPLVIGLFAFSCNVHREFIAFLCRFGISASYSRVLSQLHVLGADSKARIRAMATVDPLWGPTFVLLYDNVNKMKKAWHAVLGQMSEMRSGTAATVLRLYWPQGLDKSALRSAEVDAAIKEERRQKMTTKELRDDCDWTHIRGIGTGHILRIWLKYIPALRVHREDVEKLFSEKHAKHVLETRRTEAHSLSPSNIDESTASGAADVLRNLLAQLGVVGDTISGWLVLVCGDQLTIDRVRKLKAYARKNKTPYSRNDWALPLIQLWHLKWNWQKAIFRMHWTPQLVKDYFGLHHDCALLDRGKFNPDKCDFYPGDQILRDRLEALLLEAFRLLLEEKTKIVHGAELTLLDILPKYFAEGAVFDNISFETLEMLATTVYNRYMTNRASEAALGQHFRKTDIYGPEWTGVSYADELRADKLSQTSTEKDVPPKGNSVPNVVVDNLTGGDQALVTTCNFMRATFWYLELCAAIAEGDIGRVCEILKVLRFSFWGAGSTNYGNELLELACNFLYEWPADLQYLITENWLANTSGRPGHWLELDLLQEHWIFWLKNLFNSKSHDFDSKHLTEAVGLNIPGISKLREWFPGVFGLKRNSGKHRKILPVDDINRLGMHYRERHILSFDRTRTQPITVLNEFSEGSSKLDVQLGIFLERTKGGARISAEDEEEYEGVPPQPAILVDGILEADG